MLPLSLPYRVGGPQAALWPEWGFRPSCVGANWSGRAGAAQRNETTLRMYRLQGQIPPIRSGTTATAWNGDTMSGPRNADDPAGSGNSTVADAGALSASNVRVSFLGPIFWR